MVGEDWREISRKRHRTLRGSNYDRRTKTEVRYRRHYVSNGGSGASQGNEKRLGDERFKSSFPELEGLSDTIADKIGGQESTLKEALEKCGLPGLTETETTVEEE